MTKVYKLKCSGIAAGHELRFYKWRGKMEIEYIDLDGESIELIQVDYEDFINLIKEFYFDMGFDIIGKDRHVGFNIH